MTTVRGLRSTWSMCSVLEEWNGVTPIRCLETRAEITIYADASGVHGYGATSPQAKAFTMGKWTDVEMEQAFRLKANSSTYLEVMAICIAIATFGTPGSSITVQSDSQSAVYILQKKYCKGSDEIQGKIIATDRWLLEKALMLTLSTC